MLYDTRMYFESLEIEITSNSLGRKKNFLTISRNDLYSTYHIYI